MFPRSRLEKASRVFTAAAAVLFLVRTPRSGRSRCSKKERRSSKPLPETHPAPPPNFPPENGSRDLRQWACTAALVVALVVTSAGVRAAEPLWLPGAPRIRIVNRLEAAAVLAAVEGATRRLEREECRRIFSEFSDVAGRTLLANLEALGATPQAYLSLIGFYGGGADRRCARPDILAFTSPGNRTVRICPQFARLQLGDPRLAEMTILHEALHTLGLGENPPLSTVITERVAARCGR